MRADRVACDLRNQTLTLSFPKWLTPGQPAVLTIDFSGELNDSLAGLYRSTHKADDGTEKVIAVTQFEPTDARRALPCWDEPALKAVFQVEVRQARAWGSVESGSGGSQGSGR